MDIPVVAIAAVVDREGYNSKYKEMYGDKQWNLCKTAFSILTERSLKYVIKRNGKLRIKFEAGGKDYNNCIIDYARSLKRDGLPFNRDTSAKYNELSKEDINNFLLGEPERKKKNNRITQIADLYLYSVAKGGYDKNFEPYQLMFEHKTIIDSFLTPEECIREGVKYSCFN